MEFKNRNRSTQELFSQVLTEITESEILPN